jgi:hypothetical protein
VTEPATPTGSFSGRTPWSRSLQAPLRAFLQTESGSAGVLLLATVAALVWANLAPEAYAAFWETPLAIRVGRVDLALTLRDWVNSGLMTFFFSSSGWRFGGSSTWASCGNDVGRRFQCWLAWGHDRAGCDLPGPERWPGLGRRLGNDDVDRHRICLGAAGAGGPRSPGPCPGYSCSPWSWWMISWLCW